MAQKKKREAAPPSSTTKKKFAKISRKRRAAAVGRARKNDRKSAAVPGERGASPSSCRRTAAAAAIASSSSSSSSTNNRGKKTRAISSKICRFRAPPSSSEKSPGSSAHDLFDDPTPRDYSSLSCHPSPCQPGHPFFLPLPDHGIWGIQRKRETLSPSSLSFPSSSPADGEEGSEQRCSTVKRTQKSSPRDNDGVEQCEGEAVQREEISAGDTVAEIEKNTGKESLDIAAVEVEGGRDVVVAVASPRRPQERDMNCSRGIEAKTEAEAGSGGEGPFPSGDTISPCKTKGTNKKKNAALFRRHVWPALFDIGWSLSHRSRPSGLRDVFYCKPGKKNGKPYQKGRDYFDSISKLRNYLMGEDGLQWRERGVVAEKLDFFQRYDEVGWAKVTKGCSRERFVEQITSRMNIQGKVPMDHVATLAQGGHVKGGDPPISAGGKQVEEGSKELGIEHWRFQRGTCGGGCAAFTTPKRRTRSNSAPKKTHSGLRFDCKSSSLFGGLGPVNISYRCSARNPIRSLNFNANLLSLEERLENEKGKTESEGSRPKQEEEKEDCDEETKKWDGERGEAIAVRPRKEDLSGKNDIAGLKAVRTHIRNRPLADSENFFFITMGQSPEVESGRVATGSTKPGNVGGVEMTTQNSAYKTKIQVVGVEPDGPDGIENKVADTAALRGHLDRFPGTILLLEEERKYIGVANTIEPEVNGMEKMLSEAASVEGGIMSKRSTGALPQSFIHNVGIPRRRTPQNGNASPHVLEGLLSSGAVHTPLRRERLLGDCATGSISDRQQSSTDSTRGGGGEGDFAIVDSEGLGTRSFTSAAELAETGGWQHRQQGQRVPPTEAEDSTEDMENPGSMEEGLDPSSEGRDVATSSPERVVVGAMSPLLLPGAIAEQALSLFCGGDGTNGPQTLPHPLREEEQGPQCRLRLIMSLAQRFPQLGISSGRTNQVNHLLQRRGQIADDQAKSAAASEWAVGCHSGTGATMADWLDVAAAVSEASVGPEEPLYDHCPGIDGTSDGIFVVEAVAKDMAAPLASVQVRNNDGDGIMKICDGSDDTRGFLENNPSAESNTSKKHRIYAKAPDGGTPAAEIPCSLRLGLSKAAGIFNKLPSPTCLQLRKEGQKRLVGCEVPNQMFWSSQSKGDDALGLSPLLLNQSACRYCCRKELLVEVDGMVATNKKPSDKDEPAIKNLTDETNVVELDWDEELSVFRRNTNKCLDSTCITYSGGDGTEVASDGTFLDDNIKNPICFTKEADIGRNVELVVNKNILASSKVALERGDYDKESSSDGIMETALPATCIKVSRVHGGIPEKACHDAISSMIESELMYGNLKSSEMPMAPTLGVAKEENTAKNWSNTMYICNGNAKRAWAQVRSDGMEAPDAAQVGSKTPAISGCGLKPQQPAAPDADSATLRETTVNVKDFTQDFNADEIDKVEEQSINAEDNSEQQKASEMNAEGKNAPKLAAYPVFITASDARKPLVETDLEKLATNPPDVDSRTSIASPGSMAENPNTGKAPNRESSLLSSLEKTERERLHLNEFCKNLTNTIAADVEEILAEAEQLALYDISENSSITEPDHEADAGEQANLTSAETSNIFSPAVGASVLSVPAQATLADAPGTASLLQLGCNVSMESRCRPHSSKPVGIGRIEKLHCGSKGLTPTVDAKYILGGSDKCVPASFISLTNEDNDENKDGLGVGNTCSFSAPASPFISDLAMKCTKTPVERKNTMDTVVDTEENKHSKMKETYDILESEKKISHSVIAAVSNDDIGDFNEQNLHLVDRDVDEVETKEEAIIFDPSVAVAVAFATARRDSGRKILRNKNKVQMGHSQQQPSAKVETNTAVPVRRSLRARTTTNFYSVESGRAMVVAMREGKELSSTIRRKKIADASDTENDSKSATEMSKERFSLTKPHIKGAYKRGQLESCVIGKKKTREKQGATPQTGRKRGNKDKSASTTRCDLKEKRTCRNEGLEDSSVIAPVVAVPGLSLSRRAAHVVVDSLLFIDDNLSLSAIDNINAAGSLVSSSKKRIEPPKRLVNFPNSTLLIQSSRDDDATKSDKNMLLQGSKNRGSDYSAASSNTSKRPALGITKTPSGDSLPIRPQELALCSRELGITSTQTEEINPVNDFVISSLPEEPTLSHSPSKNTWSKTSPSDLSRATPLIDIDYCGVMATSVAPKDLTTKSSTAHILSESSLSQNLFQFDKIIAPLGPTENKRPSEIMVESHTPGKALKVLSPSKRLCSTVPPCPKTAVTNLKNATPSVLPLDLTREGLVSSPFVTPKQKDGSTGDPQSASSNTSGKSSIRRRKKRMRVIPLSISKKKKVSPKKRHRTLHTVGGISLKDSIGTTVLDGIFDNQIQKEAHEKAQELVVNSDNKNVSKSRNKPLDKSGVRNQKMKLAHKGVEDTSGLGTPPVLQSLSKTNDLPRLSQSSTTDLGISKSSSVKGTGSIPSSSILNIEHPSPIPKHCDDLKAAKVIRTQQSTEKDGHRSLKAVVPEVKKKERQSLMDTHGQPELLLGCAKIGSASSRIETSTSLDESTATSRDVLQLGGFQQDPPGEQQGTEKYKQNFYNSVDQFLENNERQLSMRTRDQSKSELDKQAMQESKQKKMLNLSEVVLPDINKIGHNSSINIHDDPERPAGNFKRVCGNLNSSLNRPTASVRELSQWSEYPNDPPEVQQSTEKEKQNLSTAVDPDIENNEHQSSMNIHGLPLGCTKIGNDSLVTRSNIPFDECGSTTRVFSQPSESQDDPPGVHETEFFGRMSPLRPKTDIESIANIGTDRISTKHSVTSASKKQSFMENQQRDLENHVQKKTTQESLPTEEKCSFLDHVRNQYAAIDKESSIANKDLSSNLTSKFVNSAVKINLNPNRQSKEKLSETFNVAPSPQPVKKMFESVKNEFLTFQRWQLERELQLILFRIEQMREELTRLEDRDNSDFLSASLARESVWKRLEYIQLEEEKGRIESRLGSLSRSTEIADSICTVAMGSSSVFPTDAARGHNPENHISKRMLITEKMIFSPDNDTPHSPHFGKSESSEGRKAPCDEDGFELIEIENHGKSKSNCSKAFIKRKVIVQKEERNEEPHNSNKENLQKNLRKKERSELNPTEDNCESDSDCLKLEDKAKAQIEMRCGKLRKKESSKHQGARQKPDEYESEQHNSDLQSHPEIDLSETSKIEKKSSGFVNGHAKASEVSGDSNDIVKAQQMNNCGVLEKKENVEHRDAKHKPGKPRADQIGPGSQPEIHSVSRAKGKMKLSGLRNHFVVSCDTDYSGCSKSEENTEAHNKNRCGIPGKEGNGEHQEARRKPCRPRVDRNFIGLGFKQNTCSETAEKGEKKCKDLCKGEDTSDCSLVSDDTDDYDNLELNENPKGHNRNKYDTSIKKNKGEYQVAGHKSGRSIASPRANRHITDLQSQLDISPEVAAKRERKYSALHYEKSTKSFDINNRNLSDSNHRGPEESSKSRNEKKRGKPRKVAISNGGSTEKGRKLLVRKKRSIRKQTPSTHASTPAQSNNNDVDEEWIRNEPSKKSQQKESRSRQVLRQSSTVVKPKRSGCKNIDDEKKMKDKRKVSTRQKRQRAQEDCVSPLVTASMVGDNNRRQKAPPQPPPFSEKDTEEETHIYQRQERIENSVASPLVDNSDGLRPCESCLGCLEQDDCGKCQECLTMSGFRCVQRQCLKPLLLVSSMDRKRSRGTGTNTRYSLGKGKKRRLEIDDPGSERHVCRKEVALKPSAHDMPGIYPQKHPSRGLRSHHDLDIENLSAVSATVDNLNGMESERKESCHEFKKKKNNLLSEKSLREIHKNTSSHREEAEAVDIKKKSGKRTGNISSSLNTSTFVVDVPEQVTIDSPQMHLHWSAAQMIRDIQRKERARQTHMLHNDDDDMSSIDSLAGSLLGCVAAPPSTY